MSEDRDTFGAAGPMASIANQMSQFQAPRQGRVDTFWLYQFLTMGAYIIFNVLALPSELCLRSKFGERYIDPLMLLLGYFYMLFFTSIAGFASQEGSAGALIPILAQIYGLIAIYHLIRLKIRNAKGVDCHSYSPGVPHRWILIPTQKALAAIYRRLPKSMQHTGPLGFLARSEMVAISFVEPPLWVLIGFLLSLIFGGSLLLLWLPTAAAMACKATLNRFFSRQEILNRRDAQYEAEHQQNLMAGIAKSPSQSKGVPSWSPEFPATTSTTPAQAVANLPPEIKTILGATGTPQGTFIPTTGTPPSPSA